MATLPGFLAISSLSISTSNLSSSLLTPSPAIPFRRLGFHVRAFTSSFGRSTVSAEKPRRLKSIRAAEEEALIAAQQEGSVDSSSSYDQPPVTVPVSPSDTLTMLFQAEGTMSESAIPTVTNALQGQEDITNLKVQVVEGIASVELTKQTTVQATGVASSLIETIQGSGFKLQTLSLSFEDGDEVFV